MPNPLAKRRRERNMQMKGTKYNMPSEKNDLVDILGKLLGDLWEMFGSFLVRCLRRS